MSFTTDLQSTVPTSKLNAVSKRLRAALGAASCPLPREFVDTALALEITDIMTFVQKLIDTRS